ncbi:hypothetical protein H6P81_007401 [Aristolochia fimbriata]|uniref:VQ domain-containing protein n=1 Tax=Aristolochia fimbriata TaxID=158543 RepID=A0AAV7F3H1_ARIFI|nr:hypothetical protein H6P81_007401 [Aristolochia fimbriata]
MVDLQLPRRVSIDRASWSFGGDCLKAELAQADLLWAVWSNWKVWLSDSAPKCCELWLGFVGVLSGLQIRVWDFRFGFEMENSNFSRNRQNDHLGVNKIGKSIRKSPIHQSNFANPKQQPQPQVYNISKNDFRNIVQQLTGSPSQEPSLMGSVPPLNPPKPPSLRLQKIRPPPLSPIARPPIAAPVTGQVPFNNINPAMNPNTHPAFFNRPPQASYAPFPPGDSTWPQPAESPISAYMRYLQNSIIDSGSKQSPLPPHGQGPASSGILPYPAPPFPSPRGNTPALLPSPTSQFLMSSPTSFLNLLSPRSPYPLLSPGFQYPPPMTPNFSFSPLPQSSGILGPGPQLPPSPGLLFPASPTGFLPVSSPRWRE